jgi:hypothetical protein
MCYKTGHIISSPHKIIYSGKKPSLDIVGQSQREESKELDGVVRTFNFPLLLREKDNLKCTNGSLMILLCDHQL